MKSFSITEAFRFAWNTFKRDPWVYVGAALVMAVVSIIVNSLSDSKEPGLIEFVVSIVGVVASWWLTLGFTRMALAAHAGLPVKFEMLFKESTDVLWRYAIAAVVSGIIIVVGLVLLIVPGIIAMTALSLVIFLVLEKGMKPIEALKESRRMTEGKRWDLFLLILAFAVLNILGMIPMGLGLLVTMPLTLLAFVYVYKAIDRGDDMAPVTPTQMPPASTPTPTA